MVPFQAVLVPLFLELHDFHLLNSLAGLALFYTAFTPARYLGLTQKQLPTFG
jgi:ABC-type glycerol-3-phosphate transport system permease component